jgi:hypothetical protein
MSMGEEYGSHHRQDGRRQHRPFRTVAVDEDADGDLNRREGEEEGAGEKTRLGGRKMKLPGQIVGDDAD